MREQLAVPRLAPPHVRPHAFDEGLLVERFRPREGLGVETQTLGIRVAVEGRAAGTDAPGVDADEVEAPGDELECRGRRGADEVDTLPPEPPGWAKSEPIRRLGSAAGARISASSIVLPRGES